MKLTNVIILIAALTAVTPLISFAQQSAQAVMKVSVVVVPSVRIEAPLTAQFSLSKDVRRKELNELGNFSLGGMEESEIYVEFPDHAVLWNKQGEMIEVSIQAQKEERPGKGSSFRITSPPVGDSSMKGQYKGNYNTSIIYI